MLYHVQLPTTGMDVGGGPFSPKNVNFGFHAKSENSNLHSHFQGEAPTPMAHKSQFLFHIFFVSSNWVVINHKRGEIVSAIKPLLWVLALMTT
jgi:hypothetical protein